MTKKNRNFRSVHERQLRVLEDARLTRSENGHLPLQAEVFTTSSPMYAESTPVREPVETKPRPMTFNWEGSKNSPIFQPNLLQSGELPRFRGPLLTLVNYTATGAELPDGLRENLRNYLSDEIGDAISEGIKRWHSHGKERK